MTGLNVNDITTSDERRVRVEVDGGPILKRLYGKRLYRLVSVTITYRSQNDGPWRATEVEMRGPFVKKDGSDGAETIHDRVWDWAGHEWLPEMVARYLPGDPS